MRQSAESNREEFEYVIGVLGLQSGDLQFGCLAGSIAHQHDHELVLILILIHQLHDITEKRNKIRADAPSVLQPIHKILRNPLSFNLDAARVVVHQNTHLIVIKVLDLTQKLLHRDDQLVPGIMAH